MFHHGRQHGRPAPGGVSNGQRTFVHQRFYFPPSFCADHLVTARTSGGVLRPSCEVCGATERDAVHLSKCSRCNVVLYCSRAHQREDFSNHKARCKGVKSAREHVEKEEAELRDAQPDNWLPAHVFEEGVGHFWGYPKTRPYMRAKFDLLYAVTTLRTHASMTEAKMEMRDCLRLCRSDNIGLREMLPPVLLLLGEYQECYDVIKWYGTTGSRGDYDWGDMEQPFLDVQDADMTESFAPFIDHLTVFMAAALAYLKMTLAKQAGELIDAQTIVEITALPTELGDPVGDFLAPSWLHEDNLTVKRLKKLQRKLERQAGEAFLVAKWKNEHYWPSMLDPTPIIEMEAPSACTSGDEYEIKQWIHAHAALWGDDDVGLPFIRKRLGLE